MVCPPFSAFSGYASLAIRRIFARAAALFALLILAACATTPREAELGVRLGPPVHYRSPAGETFVARYGALSDGSLSFVRLTLPDGRRYTLPQALSASGARYTDGRELVWWEHQGKVRVETRNAAGGWTAPYGELREAGETR